jgi:DNA-3-methyladenine glycosylase
MIAIGRLPPLERSFFARDAATVARDLLGQILVHESPRGLLAARIVETEAYLGSQDLASHARFGRTARNASMFGPPGHAYVYFVYGMHTMTNVVTGAAGEPQAVLLRAAEAVAVEGVSMSGPALLSRAMLVTLAHDGVDLSAGALRIVAGSPPRAVSAGPRVGVGYAGAWTLAPLRFVDPDSTALSRPAQWRPPPGRARSAPSRPPVGTGL